MAIESRDEKYEKVLYNCHKDENYNKDLIKRNNKSFGTQTIEKVDASTMTDPLTIDIKLTSEYLTRCENYHNKYTSQIQWSKMSLIKYDDDHSSLSHNSHDIKPKIEYDIESTTSHVKGKIY